MNQQAATQVRDTRPDPASDEALRVLLLAAANGCSASFEQLYARTNRRIFGIVLRIVRHRAEAEEVLQDIYVKAWSRSRQFNASRGLVIAWLTGIAQRAAIDTLRRASCRPRELSEAAEGDDPYGTHACAGPGPAEQFEQAQTQRLVQTRLSALPHDQRESLVLAFVEGLTHPEIARKLACPLGTIKSRIRRALMALQPALQATQ